MDLLGSADETYRRKTEAPFIIAGLGSLDQTGMRGKAQVVVGAHIYYAVGCCCIDTGALGCCDDALALIGSCLTDRI